MDRDSKFSAAFRRILADVGVNALRLPPRSPNLNAHLERFWRSLREESGATKSSGVENRLIEPQAEVGRTTGKIQCRKRLGGILCYYYRRAG
jgi:putative transposase